MAKKVSNKIASKGKKESQDNYLDYVPIISDKHRWETDEEGNVTIFIENKGIFNWLAQKLLKKPKVSQLHLEKFGSFIFPLIDGKTTIYEIGQKVGVLILEMRLSHFTLDLLNISKCFMIMDL